MYMADPEVRAATMIGIVDENRELDKWQVLKGLRKLENSVHATEQRIYGAMFNKSVRPDGLSSIIRLDLVRASDQIFNSEGFDLQDIQSNMKKLGLKDDKDYLDLMAE